MREGGGGLLLVRGDYYLTSQWLEEREGEDSSLWWSKGAISLSQPTGEEGEGPKKDDSKQNSRPHPQSND